LRRYKGKGSSIRKRFKNRGSSTPNGFLGQTAPGRNRSEKRRREKSHRNAYRVLRGEHDKKKKKPLEDRKDEQPTRRNSSPEKEDQTMGGKQTTTRGDGEGEPETKNTRPKKISRPDRICTPSLGDSNGESHGERKL